MKFANLALDSDKKMENIGDWVQIFAIENLFEYMNIKKNEIVHIKISELSTYDGEYVILPINYPLYGYYHLSYKIIPVFLGISVMSESVIEGLRMRNFQPIGCRDYHTLQEMHKAGLEAYYGGCLTITFHKREKESVNKVFIVDVSDNVLNRIPNHIRENAEYIKHVYYHEECGGEEKARKIYDRYRREAGLVITSRIHCAQPCLAAGIPVIFICEIKSFRYELIKQFLPVYTLNEMDQIDWNPKPVELEEHKRRMLECAADRVWDTYKKYENICEISDFYLSGPKFDYEIDSVWAFQRYIREQWSNKDVFQYAIWGITQIAEVIYTWVKNNYPNAVLVQVIDNKVREAFHGVLPESADALEKCEVPVFVTAGSANPVAEETFQKYHVTKYVICYGNLYIVDGIHKTY